ncbi:hypothetical protein M413DRAFT_446984 [Hebeloma cylindrosporum]|uniref:Zn(2)-C6 fungal-type domain-containing protein n=1 Tax=Hebeloma cylindrosporum TaxID=76867 RepID=A0A0C3C7B3_HEBCY|nr:hypothetical protein M413DRAFT_446984 [Hebeloma cylindrosporum h7]
MPVDNTRVISPRRTQKKLTEEELKDIERKRLLGELSCAECRRLKLRCDKKLPCGSCLRRGCESICPLGILAAGQGTRFILADTEQLHEKIYEMSNRIRQLEDALAILQSTVSDLRHPLLTEELLKVKFGSESINARQATTSDDESPATSKSIDALGTLTLGSSGEVQYFGSSAGSETLMMRAGEEADGPSDDDQDSTPLDMFLEVENLANLFPFTAKGRPNNTGLGLLETFLPSQERARQLCDSYTNHATYFFRPIKSEELLDVLFPSIYNGMANRKQNASARVVNDDHVDFNTPHALATLYFVFALGCLLDLTRMPYNSEAERYYDLGRAALSLRAVYDSPNMDSVQAMGLMATYHSLAGKRYSRDSAWCIMSFAAKLAQSIGLHRDSARWHMDPKTVQKRRNLFWEVFSADVSHSLALGRPPAIHLSYVDCEFPLDEDASLSDDAEHQTGFWRMKHTFAKDIYNSVAEATLVAKSPGYSTILDLDRKVREMSFPASFNPYVTRDVGPEIFHSSSLSLRDFYASQHRTVTMIYLHRSFFAQAMLDHPTNPLLSPFAPSFLTAYRSASVIIKASAHLFERCAAMAMRLWFLMYHTFSAAVIVGTVVTRSPNSNIASIAMRDFNLALTLFEQTAAQSQRAKVALGILLKLKEKANRVYEGLSHGIASPTPSVESADELEDDLAIFGGQMRVLDRKGKNPNQRSPSMSSSGHASASGSSPKTPSSNVNVSPTSPSESGMLGLGLGLPDVHPSLITYLNQDAVRRAVSQQQQQHGPVSSSDTQSASTSAHEGPYERSHLVSGRSQNPSTQASGGNNTQSTSRSSSFIPRPDPVMEWATTGTSHDPPGQTAPSSSFNQYPSSPNQSGMGTTYQSQANIRPPILRRAPVPVSNHNASRTFTGHSLIPPPATQQATASARSEPPGNVYSPRPSHFYGQYTGYDYSSGGHGSFYGGTTGPMDSGLGHVHGSQNINVTTTAFGMLGPTEMHSTGAVEMGLSSESGMDAGWLSFMRDCGIMDTTEGS